jgi:hypothetical protein
MPYWTYPLFDCNPEKYLNILIFNMFLFDYNSESQLISK